MIAQSLRSRTRVLKTENIDVVYNLRFKNALYCLECFVEGNSKDFTHYSFVEDLTDDEEEAKLFLHKMAKGKVLPVHIKDMADDYFEE